MGIKSMLTKFLRLLLPQQIKVLLLKIHRRYLDLVLSFTSEVPMLQLRRRTKNFASRTSKRYDCFYFFDELEILELRLNILNDYVDFFVICESSKTFSGRDKPLVFQENRELFHKFLHKIIYIPLDWSPLTQNDAREVFHRVSSTLQRLIAMRTLTSPNVPKLEGANHWLTEYYQKESLHLALTECKDEDIIYISDVDEIWNPIRQFHIRGDRIYIFKQVPYIYYLNNRSNEHWHSWTGSIVARYGLIKDKSINDVRTHGKVKRYVILRGGWHFSFQGGVDRIIRKLDSYGHQELNVPEVISNVHNLISERRDIHGRAVKHRRSNRGLPEYLLNNAEYYSEMLI